MAEQTSSAFGWMMRYVMLPAIVAILGLVAVGGYFAYRDHRIRAFTGDVRPFLEQLGLDFSPRATERTSKVLVDVPPPVEPPPAVEVDSYPPDALYPLESWQVVNDPAGFVDWVKVDGEVQPIDSPIQVAHGQVVEFGGWAGHRLLGMRFEEVLLSVCDIVIAGTPVDIERPDIAATIHPNLNIAGWHARLFASDIPACADATISIWGRPPVGTTLRPIVGGRAVKVVDSENVDPGPVATVMHVRPAVLPEQAPSPVSIRLEILTPPLVLRQCADTECPPLAETAQLVFEAVVVERRDGWLLLQSAAGSGWIPAGDVVPAP